MNARTASRYLVHTQKVSVRGKSMIRKGAKMKMNQLLENRAVPASSLEAQSASRLLSQKNQHTAFIMSI